MTNDKKRAIVKGKLADYVKPDLSGDKMRWEQNLELMKRFNTRKRRVAPASMLMKPKKGDRIDQEIIRGTENALGISSYA